MRILFIFYEDPALPASFPLGVGLLSAILEKNGHITKGLYVHHDLSPAELEDIASRVDSFRPGLLAYSATTPAYEHIRQIAYFLKNRFNIPSIIGGAHATLYPHKTLKTEGIDYVCVGEGEISFPQFVEAMEKRHQVGSIAGILAPDDIGREKAFKLPPLFHDLDNLPWTNYDLFGKNFIQQLTSDGWLRHIASRGCPYNCSYCHTPMFRKIYAKGVGVTEAKLGYLRFRSIESIIDELQVMVGKYNLKVINFMDDLFCLKKNRTLSFCEAFRHQLPEAVGYSIQTHLAHLDEQVIEALRGSRCLRVVVGVESGSQRILDLFKRRTTPEDMLKKLAMLSRYKFLLGTWALNIIGNPTETVEEMKQTLALNAEAMVERAKFNMLAPYPDSEIYNYCVDHNLLWTPYDSQAFADRRITRLKFPEKELAFLEKFFDIGHWYMNIYAPLNLQNEYQPLIDEVETIGPNEWQMVRENYLKKDKKLTDRLCNLKKTHYAPLFEGKVTTYVVGLRN